MDEKLNDVIEDTMVDIYLEGIENFMAKMGKNIEPSVEACRKMFYRTYGGNDGDLYLSAEWEKIVKKARSKAARMIFIRAD